jgi:hypothetical protein
MEMWYLVHDYEFCNYILDRNIEDASQRKLRILS